MSVELKPSSENLKAILDYLHISLRYIVAGFFPLLVFSFIDPERAVICKNIFHESEILLFGICCLIGIVLYSVHKAMLDRWFYKRAIRRYIINNKLPNELNNRMTKEMGSFDFYRKNRFLVWIQRMIYGLRFSMHSLDPYAHAISRKSGKVGGAGKIVSPTINMVCERVLFELYTFAFRDSSFEKSSVVRKLEDRYAILAFLYCAAYGTFLVATWYTIMLYYHSKAGPIDLIRSVLEERKLPSVFDLITIRILLSYLFVFFIIMANRRFGYRLVRREMYHYETMHR